MTNNDDLKPFSWEIPEDGFLSFDKNGNEEWITSDDWAWSRARHYFLKNDTEPMEIMLLGKVPIPSGIRNLLANFVAGNIKVMRRGQGKHRVLDSSAKEIVDELINGFRYGHSILRNKADAARLNWVCGEDREDAGTVEEEYEKELSTRILDLAERYAVTPSAIKKCADRLVIDRRNARLQIEATQNKF